MGKFPVKHGMARTRLYGIWRSMKKRCLLETHLHYRDYGGRGITICPEWMVFENFADWALRSGYQDSLSIDRKDTNGPYKPDNCRWSTDSEQAHNKRSNHNLTFNGRTLPLRAWSRELGLNRETIKDRIYKKGMTVEQAFSMPVKLYRKKIATCQQPSVPFVG